MPIRYKVIGRNGADDNYGDGFSASRIVNEAGEWVDAAEDPTTMIVPLNDPWRSTDPSASEFRGSRLNERLRKEYGGAMNPEAAGRR
jgi:hypothetical protein